MKKTDLLKIIDISSFVAVCVATALVVIFQFVGESVLITIAMSFYALGFLMLSVQFGFKVFENFSKKSVQQPAEEPSAEELTDSTESETVPSKKTKTWNIAGLVGSFLVFVFTIVVIILY